MSAKADAIADVIRTLQRGPLYEGLFNRPEEEDAIRHLTKSGLVRRTYNFLGVAKLHLVEG